MAEATTELEVTGMTCGNCARHVAEALREVEGVSSVKVELVANSAMVRWKPQCVPNQAALVGAVESAGYAAKAAPARAVGQACPRPRASGWEWSLALGLCATLPMMVAEWGFGLGMRHGYHWTAFALALPVQILAGGRFYAGAWRQLRQGASNMDTLVALGSTTAFGYSLWRLLTGWHGHLFFMDGAAIITLISLGHFLEMKATAQAANSVRALLDLAPEKARLVGENGAETEVAVGQLRPGDKVSIRPGDRVPVDGTVAEGNTAMDESMMTGESMPVEKAPGSVVYAGALNQNGRIVAKVTATGEETALARIIQIVEQAQSSRANIQRLGDRVSAVFVPIVVLLAALTGLWWGLAPESAAAASAWLGQFLWPASAAAEGPLSSAIVHVAAVLIVACPCAMGLATPIAIMAGTNAAAKRGILIRDGVALEKTGTLTAILFDKTGTLTTGKVAVAARAQFESKAQGDVDQAAASVASHSNHPLSRAIAGIASPTLPMLDWTEERGSGVSARAVLHGGTGSGSTASLCLGSLTWMEQLGVPLEQGRAFIDEGSRNGSTILAFAINNRLAALYALSDPLKAEAPAVVRLLKAQGKAVYMVTGDRTVTARRVAEQLGLEPDRVFAQTRPEEKAAIVKRLQQEGQKVAFVGDGINDAPALAQADLGIALMNASDAARNAADIILLKSGIEAIPEALGLARATLRTIKQNLFWAFFYNAAGIPLAMLGFFTPILSALAMGLSDFIVIGNALRLRFWKKPL